MRLERLEVSGFKSFSDRSELAFDKGVTAIVGPNGCGKSNVADAITWVLGEQSAKSLRGDKMEDIIFCGSDARKAGATAEVRVRLAGLPTVSRADSGRANGEHESSLGLEPSRDTDAVARGDHNGNGHGNGHGHGALPIDALAQAFTRDVEVTRRLYRSGESEYRIDGQVCRLRDVHELLMDTGLGAKAYAIIEQGKIGLILSSRPADRRQLIEEAAGITKYRSRRRAAELRLDAARQNLTRIDDIVFEIERQRAALKRQAAKTRRFRRLRDELHRWEKVQIANRYHDLAARLETANAKVERAREREAVASARLAEVETDFVRLRLEQAETDARVTAMRETAHTCELEVARRQQQLEFDRHQSDALVVRGRDIEGEIGELVARREPARIAVEARSTASCDAAVARDEAAVAVASAGEALTAIQRQIDQHEADAEVARRDVFSAANIATALSQVVEHATVQHERVSETLARLQAERDDVRRERERADTEQRGATDALARARQAMEEVSLERVARESELAVARGEYELRARRIRALEQELAGGQARLASFEEFEAGREGFGDAARMVLIQANGHVGQQGAVADYLETDDRYERAVEACLGDLLQHVIVERQEQAEAGLALVREHDAGRCGFLVTGAVSPDNHPREEHERPGVVPVSRVLRFSGPFGRAIESVLPEAYVAVSFEQAAELSHQTSAPVATLEGDVFRGPHLLTGGSRPEVRGLLQSKREIKELRERLTADRESLAKLAEEAAGFELGVALATSAITALQGEQHRQEKQIVAHEAQTARLAADSARLEKKAEVVDLELRRAEEELAALEVRSADAQASMARLAVEREASEARLAQARRTLLDARDAAEALGGRAAEARAAHAGLLERASALADEVIRLSESARELEERIATRKAELEQTRLRQGEILAAVEVEERVLDEGVRELAALTDRLRQADEGAAVQRAGVDRQETTIREARLNLESVRADVSAFDVERATTHSDLLHLAQACTDALQLSLEQVVSEVEQFDIMGGSSPSAVLVTDDLDPDVDEMEPGAQDDSAPITRSMTIDEALLDLRAKIDRLGPVNMMAVEQFDELEARNTFLVTQRKDLIDSIAQTSEAIARIDETSTQRFREAFVAIQHNFQQTFSTLFGGGHAGLVLLDESDPLESGIDIVASPPGKRLQNVQLLSGGEKALTAIALMFGIFRYKPSPFCLLDEIDAPLDDANVGRFVEMLRGMLDRTQFILITHNRRTMEIANRLYGVTMEEPGVSKLVSVQLN